MKRLFYSFLSSSMVVPADYNRQDPNKLSPSRIVEVNQRLKRLMATNGHIYVDAYSLMANENGMLRADLSGDGIHPNYKGYAFLTAQIEKEINKPMGLLRLQRSLATR